MKKFIKSMFVIGILFEVINLVVSIVAIINWQDVVSLYYSDDFSKETVNICIPYMIFALYSFELILSVFLMGIVLKQISSNKNSIACEVVMIIYGTLFHGVFLYISNIIYGNSAKAFIVNSLSAKANSGLMEFFRMASSISYIGIAAILVGCGASLAIKKNENLQ